MDSSLNSRKTHPILKPIALVCLSLHGLVLVGVVVLCLFNIVLILLAAFFTVGLALLIILGIIFVIGYSFVISLKYYKRSNFSKSILVSVLVIFAVAEAGFYTIRQIGLPSLEQLIPGPGSWMKVG